LIGSVSSAANAVPVCAGDWWVVVAAGEVVVDDWVVVVADAVVVDVDELVVAVMAAVVVVLVELLEQPVMEPKTPSTITMATTHVMT
jgi:hypothetical protein